MLGSAVNVHEHIRKDTIKNIKFVKKLNVERTSATSGYIKTLRHPSGPNDIVIRLFLCRYRCRNNVVNILNVKVGSTSCIKVVPTLESDIETTSKTHWI